MTRHEELTARGWHRQVTYDEPRLSDIVEMYREMGMEVHLEPFDAATEPGCSECMKAAPDKYATIYTRSVE
ncbi:MAG: hypothetical protein JEZ11_27825 [Desulfobacterales bacterium]|nr:hypothetical protein [Desulfobacterales bacterium]